MRQTFTHGECGSEWTGLTRSHCPACHRTFNRDGGAERHRTGRHGIDRRCQDPATLDYTERDGIWYTPAGDNPW